MRPGRGELVLVATPIGNAGDLSPRAAETLGSADVVCCEDTRHTGRLLSRLGVTAQRLVSVHEHNEQARASAVVEWLAAGMTVALVTDAGLPGISDPGARIVAAAHAAGQKVSVVPGPSAAVAAVAVAGLRDGRFRFEGFLSRKAGERRTQLGEIVASPIAVVVYEAPSRVERLLGDLAEVCGGDRVIVVCRELTKLHEEVWHGPLTDAVGRWPSASAKGEFVIVIGGAPPPLAAPVEEADLAARVARLVAAGDSRRDAVDAVAVELGLARKVVYAAATSSGRSGRSDEDPPEPGVRSSAP